MPQETHASLRHQTAYKLHRKPLHHDNALADIDPEALLLLRRHGAELVVAEGHTVRGFALSETDAHVQVRPTWHAQLPAPPIAIADASAGVLATWTTEGRTLVGLIRDGMEEAVVVIAVPGYVTALAAASGEALLAVRVPESSAGRLLRIDIARRMVLAERPLTSSEVDLQLEPTGRWLTVTDRVAGTVCTAPASLTTWPDAVPMQKAVLAAHPSTPARRADAEQCCHPDPCCCRRCAPDGNGGSGPSQPGGTGQGGTGQGGCQPGGAGAPTGAGGTVVGQGGSVGHQGPGDGGPISCWLDLLWPIHRLVRTSSYAVAIDASYRNMAIIGLDPFRLVEERQFGRSGFRFALDREAPVMIVRNLARSGGAPAVEVLDLAVADLLADPISGLVSGIVPLDSATFYGGLQVESLMSGHAPPNGPIRVLLLPVIEGAQTFSDPDISHFASYLDRTLAPHVHDYYVENSFGALNNISFNVFGRDVLPVGGPIQLPRTHLTDYYWPKYDPAKLILTRTGIPAGTQIVLDGRESMQVTVQPDGGLPPDTLDVQFAALGFSRLANLFPVEVRFDPSDRLVLQVTTPSGTNMALTLQFTANTINLTDDANLPNELAQIETYLHGVFQAAEASAGLVAPLFAKPSAQRLTVPGNAFGSLAITVAGAMTTGPKLAVHSASATVSGTDPIGLNSAMVGAIDPASPGLSSYLNFLFAVAESRKGFDDASRRVDVIAAAFDAGTGTLTTTLPVGAAVGGPTASISLASSSGLTDLFTTTSTIPNSQTNYNNAEALRDYYQLFQDAWNGAVSRLQAAGRDPKKDLAGWQVAMVFPVEAAVNKPGDPESVQPWEMWNVTPLLRPFVFRGLEYMNTIPNTTDPSIQLQAVWTIDFFTSDGKPDIAVICHELGHGIGFRDLYKLTGFREDLAYLGDWAIMNNHPKKPHHAGYHKQQAGWITDDRVITVPPTQADQTTNTEALLVPVELWDGGYPTDSRAAFGVGADMPVVQLVRLDLGGDGAVYDLIEARQTGAQFSQLLPTSPGILITNALEPWDDQRYAFNGAYRRELQLLNPNNILANPGDSFDLAKAAGLPAAGVTVTVVDRKLVRGANVFHIKITRTNTNFIDLHFANADPYYKNPDLYVDWAGDNPSRNASDHDAYPIGSPVDQGDTVRVPKKGTELHWVVARLRNRGQVHAEQVKLNFKMCVPPGGGDRSGNFQPMGSVTLPDVQGGDVPIDGVLKWDVPAGFGGHTCLAVEIADYKIPLGSDGSALATDDVWIANNHAQKNVDQFIPLQSSPYEPVEFDYSVHNDAPRPEYAYLEPDGLPYGMKLTVTPRGQTVPPKSTVIFRCRLELDNAIIDAGCRSDRQFRLVTWRRDTESTTRWGGVQYKVMPRKRCTATLSGWWDYASIIHLDGKVNPDPGGGILRLRLAFAGTDAFWVPLTLGAGGVFSWQGGPRDGATSMNAVAAFEGNMLYGPSESPLLELQPPPPIY